MRRTRRKAIEREAENLVLRAGADGPPVDVAEVARSLGAEVHYVPAPADVSGMLSQENGEVVIGVNANHHPNRKRFSIAHEIGHWRLHLGDQLPLFVDESTVYFRDDASSKAIDPNEIEANAFAAALLMPRSFLLSDLVGKRVDMNDDVEISRMARRYQVSVQALTLRLNNLALIDGLPPPGH